MWFSFFTTHPATLSHMSRLWFLFSCSSTSFWTVSMSCYLKLAAPWKKTATVANVMVSADASQQEGSGPELTLSLWRSCFLTRSASLPSLFSFTAPPAVTVVGCGNDSLCPCSHGQHIIWQFGVTRQPDVHLYTDKGGWGIWRGFMKVQEEPQNIVSSNKGPHTVFVKMNSLVAFKRFLPSNSFLLKIHWFGLDDLDAVFSVLFQYSSFHSIIVTDCVTTGWSLDM